MCVFVVWFFDGLWVSYGVICLGFVVRLGFRTCRYMLRVSDF